MGTRSRSAVALILAFVVFASSAQAAFCELACGLGARAVICHGETTQQAMPAMAPAHCGDAGHAKTATSAMSLAMGDMHDSPCRHSAEPAIETDVSNCLQHASADLPIVGLVLFSGLLHGEFRAPGTSPSLRHPPFDPLLETLRV
jgi:hypothetical protein